MKKQILVMMAAALASGILMTACGGSGKAESTAAPAASVETTKAEAETSKTEQEKEEAEKSEAEKSETEQGKDAASEAEETAESEARADQAEQSNHIVPLPAGYNVKDGIQDATIPVSFCEDPYQVDGDKAELVVIVYSEDIYDVVDVHLMKAGDTIMVSGNDIAVKTVEEGDNGSILINGGIGESEDGVTLISNGGGTYRYFGWDDISSFTAQGSWAFPVSKNCVLQDSFYIEEKEPRMIAYEEIPDYLKMLKEKQEDFFNQYNTRITVEGGEVTEITRIYTP